MAKLKFDRDPHKDNFTPITKSLIEEQRVSPYSIWLAIYILHLPEDWDFSIEGLVKATGKSEKTVRVHMMELEKIGYITKSQEKDESGRFKSYVYTIHETPKIK